MPSLKQIFKNCPLCGVCIVCSTLEFMLCLTGKAFHCVCLSSPDGVYLHLLLPPGNTTPIHRDENNKRERIKKSGQACNWAFLWKRPCVRTQRSGENPGVITHFVWFCVISECPSCCCIIYVFNRCSSTLSAVMHCGHFLIDHCGLSSCCG